VAVGIEMLRSGATAGAAFDAIRTDAVLRSACELGGLLPAVGVGVIAFFGSDIPMRRALELTPVPVAVAVLAITGGFALRFPLCELSQLLRELHPVLGIDEESAAAAAHIDSLRDAIAVPLALVALPAVGEELFFRGLLLPGLRERYGSTIALASSTLLSGAFAFAPAAIVQACAAGAIFGVVRLRTRSVLPCIAMHGAFNAVPVMLPADIVHIDGFHTSSEHIPLPLVLGSALVVSVALWMLRRLAETE
jgi:membrane protease YdiL (CAAX protease family)